MPIITVLVLSVHVKIIDLLSCKLIVGYIKPTLGWCLIC